MGDLDLNCSVHSFGEVTPLALAHAHSFQFSPPSSPESPAVSARRRVDSDAMPAYSAPHKHHGCSMRQKPHHMDSAASLVTIQDAIGESEAEAVAAAVAASVAAASPLLSSSSSSSSSSSPSPSPPPSPSDKMATNSKPATSHHVFISDTAAVAAPHRILTHPALQIAWPFPESDRFVGLDILHHTHYGWIVSAVDTRAGNLPVVIKLTSLPSLAESSRLENPLQDAQLLAELGPHPNIVTILESFIEEKSRVHFEVLEKLEGGDLFDLLAKHGQFDEEVARFFFLDIVNALRHVHASGVCHLDLSLENVLVDSHYRAKLCDFGVARRSSRGVANAGTAEGGQVPGKKTYMAPEIYCGAPFDGFKADLFSIGVMLFMMLSGSPLFTSPSLDDPWYAVIAEEGLTALLDYTMLSARVSESAANLIEWLVQPLAEDRPSCIDEVLSHSWLADHLEKDVKCGHGGNLAAAAD